MSKKSLHNLIQNKIINSLGDQKMAYMPDANIQRFFINKKILQTGMTFSIPTNSQKTVAQYPGYGSRPLYVRFHRVGSQIKVKIESFYTI